VRYPASLLLVWPRCNRGHRQASALSSRLAHSAQKSMTHSFPTYRAEEICRLARAQACRHCTGRAAQSPTLPACQEDRGRSAHHCAMPGDRQCRREGIHVPGAAGDGYGHRQFGPGHSQACCAVASTEQAACFCAVATRVSKASSSSAPSFCQRGTKVFVRPILLGLPLAISPRSCAPSEDWVLVTPRSESLGGRGCAMLPLPRSLCSRRSPLSPISASNCPARRSARSRMSVAE
jgi:hypothetical protein